MRNTNGIVIKLNMASCKCGYGYTQTRMNYTLISGTTVTNGEILPIRA